jgi:peptidoglycan/xylan/chitin deacetylase (PgdA/CDA1 family)
MNRRADSTAHARPNPAPSPTPQSAYCNDAFSFWKLPESWRLALTSSIEDSTAASEYYLFERYLDDRDRQPPAAIRTYYRLKHFIPQGLRFRINSMAVRARQRKQFPNWPCESALMDIWRDWLRQALVSVGASDGWHIGFWPRGLRCCIVLTHDVESRVGLERMEAMAELEEKHGFRSAWNVPLAQYELDWPRIERMRARGFEFGAHGLSHDGRLFRSRADFDGLVPELQRLAREHRLRGFRSPSTLRRAEWIRTMDFDFDSSFADTDPYEPQPGGSCSLFPFHLGDMIELPYTLPQDHTLINLLRHDPLSVWTMKAEWIASLGGMILTLTHPDYSGKQPYLGAYERLLERLTAIESSWRALPSEVAAWWQRRSRMRLSISGNEQVISGDDTTGAIAQRLGEHPLAK